MNHIILSLFQINLFSFNKYLSNLNLSYKLTIKIIVLYTIFIYVSISVQNPIFSEEIPTSTAKSFKKWGYVYSNSFEKFPNQYINRLQKDFDILCITGLLLRGTGQLRFENEFMNKLIKSGLNTEKVIIYPMVGISSVKEGITILSSEGARVKSIENILKFLKAYNFQGVHLDFEGLPEDYARPYASFLKELKEKLNSNNIHLSISLFPPLEFNDPNKGFHNPSILTSSVDSVVLMAYDYHNTKTEQGCVTGETWAENNIIEVKKYFKAEEIWLGIPSYGYEWSGALKSPRVVSSREAQLLKNQFPHLKEPLGCTKISKKENGKESFIFYADIDLRNGLTKLAEKYNLLGTALWRIGLEDE